MSAVVPYPESNMIPNIQPGQIIVAEGAPREDWLFERSEGVTASEALEVARAGIAARRRILETKLNGSRFKGTKSTRAGSSRESALLDEADRLLDGVATSNGALWAAASNPLHRATPDGLGVTLDGRLCVIEVKSHEYGWTAEGIPPEHYAQIQFQMHVVGAEVALYGFEVRDEDDMPPLDGATWIWVERDEEMIAWLAERADSFIAWREAGCPDTDPIPEAVDVARAAWVPLKRELDDLAKREKAAADVLKKAIAAAYPHAARFGAVAMGDGGGFQLTVSESDSIDEEVWQATDPDAYVGARRLRVRLAFVEAAAKRAFPKTTRKVSLRFQEVQGA